MTFSIQNLEIFLLILVRITAFIYVAPFFNLKNVPQKVKIGFSLCLAIILFNTITDTALSYDGVIGFAGLIMKEALVGVIIGFFTNISYYIISFSGQFIDNQIGLSMVNEFDPISNIETTITANYYSYLIMLMMLITNLHHYIIIALADTFTILPIGSAYINPNLYILMTKFMQDYFMIGFRIVLPVFAATLIVSAVLGILAKAAPQMNMFVIGIQLKIIIGLLVLLVLTTFVPTISTYIFDEMIYMMKSAIEGLL